MALPDQYKGNEEFIFFGGGLNTRTSEFDLDPREMAAGSKNFDIFLGDNNLRNRKVFDLVDTAPNGEAVHGFAQLRKQDNSLSTLVQAGSQIYQWDGNGTFTEVDTVPGGARIRGHPDTHNSTLDEKVLISDLNLSANVKEWDGTTFQDVPHNLGAGVDLKCKYILSVFERMVYANVKTTTLTPHLAAFSAIEDYTNLSTADKAPISGATAADSFYLLTPDLRPINGIVGAFGQISISSDLRNMYKITGQDKTDMQVQDFYPNSGAAGEEALVFAGNDFVYGAKGRIESLFATQTLGDVSTDNLSRPIEDLVVDFDDWNLVYNERVQKVYCLGKDSERVLVFNKSFLDERVRLNTQRRDALDVSPWADWQTDHDLAFRPECMMALYRPTDGLKQVYMGGPNGEIFMLEGSGSTDGGTTPVELRSVSRIIQSPADAVGFRLKGMLWYRRLAPTTVTVNILFAGDIIVDSATMTLTLTGPSSGGYFGGDFYFGAGGSVNTYFGARFEGRFDRARFDPTGTSDLFQIQIVHAGSTDIAIGKIRIEWESTG